MSLDALLCGFCGGTTSVSDSRPARGVDGIRRRRRCNNCGERFTTVEFRAEANASLLRIIEAEMKTLRTDIIDRLTQAEHVMWGAE